MNRRDLLRAGAVSTLGMNAASYARVQGANSRARLGMIGCGARGTYMMGKFQQAGVEVAALCDVYAAKVDAAMSRAPGARGYADHRKLLDQKDLDVALVTVPDHWHAAITIDALSAGQDVYVEKPLTLRIEEGPEIVRAARVNGRICQVGTQRRSATLYHRAKAEIFDRGKLGKITLVRTWWHGNGAHLRPAPPELAVKPSNLDWGRYLGPVKWRDWDPQQYWNFRAYLEFGGGQITDLFTHWIDAAHMLMGRDNPISAVASGGIYYYKDGRTAPDTICALLEYPDEFTATFEGTLAPSMQGTGMEICGTEAKAVFRGNACELIWADKKAPEVIEESTDHVAEHVANFLECVQSRKLPNADVYIGHRSAQASHLANIAYVQKRRLKFDPIREEILPL